jgi:hypothetical protein
MRVIRKGWLDQRREPAVGVRKVPGMIVCMGLDVRKAPVARAVRKVRGAKVVRRARVAVIASRAAAAVVAAVHPGAVSRLNEHCCSPAKAGVQRVGGSASLQRLGPGVRRGTVALRTRAHA